MMKSVGIPIRSASNLRRSRVSNRVSENRINVKCATERLITTCGRNLQLRAYQDGSSLKEAALKLNLLSADQFDEWVQPEKMVTP